MPDNLFHEISVVLAAKILLVDYINSVNTLDGIGPEGFAEEWIEAFVFSPITVKDAIFSTFIDMLVKIGNVNKFHENI